jgi:hypothetical protein
MMFMAFVKPAMAIRVKMIETGKGNLNIPISVISTESKKMARAEAIIIALNLNHGEMPLTVSSKNPTANTIPAGSRKCKKGKSCPDVKKPKSAKGTNIASPPMRGTGSLCIAWFFCGSS